MSRKKPESKQISQEWLTTYSDMMTLILTFFVLLYSFSLIDSNKFRQMAQSMAIALGGNTQTIINGGNMGPTPIDEEPGIDLKKNSTLDVETKEVEAMYKDVVKFVKDRKLNAKVTIKKTTRGVLIELQDKILFDSGKSYIKPESLQILNEISDLLKQFPNEIIVEGHTDNIPMHKGYFLSNWELSSDRAVKVAKYFVDNKKIDGKRFQAIGCGEYRPIDTNSTPEGRQKNRRVNILIITNTKK